MLELQLNNNMYILVSFVYIDKITYLSNLVTYWHTAGFIY